MTWLAIHSIAPVELFELGLEKRMGLTQAMSCGSCVVVLLAMSCVAVMHHAGDKVMLLPSCLSGDERGGVGGRALSS